MAEVLQPGVQIRPIISIDEAQKLVEKLYGIKVQSMKEMEAYDDKNYHVKISSHTENKNLEPIWKDGYVLKILNSMDSKKVKFVEAQNEMMLFLGVKGIRCTEPVKNLSGNYYSLENIPTESESRHVVRLLRFEPGEILYSVVATPALCLETGSYLARLNTALEGFSHEAYNTHTTIWALNSATKLPQFLYALKDPSNGDIVREVLVHFEKDVISTMPSLRKGMIHGDFNEHNILVRQGEDSAWHVDGVLDFGDTQHSCYLFEVALAACYLLLQAREPLEPARAAALVVAGYHRLRPLSDQELTLMQVCVCARLCQSLVLGEYSHQQDPTNTYVLQTAKSGGGWKLLTSTWALPRDNFLQLLRQEIANNK